jgi:hypothetical protein
VRWGWSVYSHQDAACARTDTYADTDTYAEARTHTYAGTNTEAYAGTNAGYSSTPTPASVMYSPVW